MRGSSKKPGLTSAPVRVCYPKLIFGQDVDARRFCRHRNWMAIWPLELSLFTATLLWLSAIELRKHQLSALAMHGHNHHCGKPLLPQNRFKYNLSTHFSPLIPQPPRPKTSKATGITFIPIYPDQ